MADEKKNEDRSVDVGHGVSDSIVTLGNENKIFQIQEAHFHGAEVGSNAVADRPTGPTTIPISLPFPSIGDLFKGRGKILQQLRESLTRKTDGHVTAIVGKALYGLGGIGKTRLAVEFAWQHKDDYSAVLLVTADSPLNLQQNLAALCGTRVLNLPEQEVRETEVQVDAVLRWLMQNPGWLLILDNVDTEDAAQEVENLLGQLQAAGQVLVTSRLSDWGGAIETLALDVLSEEDAADFLLARTDRKKGRRESEDDQQQARTLADELGGLALALEQAGAYICQRRLTLAGYLDQWQANRDKVLRWYDKRLMNYPSSVAVTWQTSVDQLTQPARYLLERLAWLAPDPIPESLLDIPLSADREGEAPAEPTTQTASSAGASPSHAAPDTDLHEALADLERYSLATRPDDVPTFTVHRLVQDVTRRSLADNDAHKVLLDTLNWINDAFAADWSDIVAALKLDPLLTHGLIVTTHADGREIAEPTARLMSCVGHVLQAKAQFAEAEPLMRRALAIFEQSYGAEHPNVALRLNILAQLLKDTNRLAEAETLVRRALAIDTQFYGAEHAHVARDLNNLAHLLKATNRLAEAEPLMRRALAIGEQSYGAEHPGVAIQLSNLGQLLHATNRLAEAEPLMRRALAIDTQSYGAEHSEVARDLNNLAALLHATNRLAEAEPLMRRALAIDTQSCGAEHPRVATELDNLGKLLQDTNRLAEAEPLMRRALAIDTQSYGAEHPKVAIRLNNLATLLRATNRLAEAEPLYHRALAVVERSYGAEHPEVAIRLNNLAGLLRATNRLAEAEPMYRRALAIDTQSYGAEHPRVAIDLNNLAGLLQATNRLAEAEPLMRRAVEILRASLGDEHPNTQMGAENLRLLLVEMDLS